MTAFLKTLPRRALTIIGSILLAVSVPELLRTSSEAEKYYWSARPLLEQLMSAQSGGEDAPAIPVVELEDRIRLGMSQAALEQRWSLTTLRRLVMAGLLVTSLGVIVEKGWAGSGGGSPGTRSQDVEG